MKVTVLKEIPIELLSRGKYQPRNDFDPQALAELAQSITQSGIVQPLIVRQLDNQSYEIIAGERRWRAAQLAKLESVPCIIKNLSDEETATVTTIENIQRQDLNPIEEAQAYARLINEFAYQHEELAAIVGKSRPAITNSLRLLNLDAHLQKLIIHGEITEGHGKVLASVTPEWQHVLVKKVLAQNWSVRTLEKQIRLLKDSQHLTPIDNDPNVARLEQAISEQLCTDVKIEADSNQSSGWLRVRFVNNDILLGILERLGLEMEAN